MAIPPDKHLFRYDPGAGSRYRLMGGGVYRKLDITPQKTLDIHVLSSPYFVYDGGEQYLLKNTESFLEKPSTEKNFLYLTVGSEPRLEEAIESFIGKLEALQPAGTQWAYSVKKNENHRSIMAVVLPEGLRAVFSDSNSLRWWRRRALSVTGSVAAALSVDIG